MKMTDGEREVAEIVVKELRRAARVRGPVTLHFVLDPWLPRGSNGVTVLASMDTRCRRYEVDAVRAVKRKEKKP